MYNHLKNSPYSGIICGEKMAVLELFTDKHKKLYNCVSYNEHDMASLKQDIKCCISTQCVTSQCYSQHTVSPNDAELAVKKLKVNKSDVNPDMSNHIIHGCKQLYVHMSLLYNTMINHSYVPEEMRLSALVPIPKHKKKA